MAKKSLERDIQELNSMGIRNDYCSFLAAENTLRVPRGLMIAKEQERMRQISIYKIQKFKFISKNQGRDSNLQESKEQNQQLNLI